MRWWLLGLPEDLKDDQAALQDRLWGQCPLVQTAQAVTQEFGRIVREGDRAAFDGWITTAETCGVAELRAMATFMRRDDAAIVAGLTLPWSQGQTEGQVTKLKLVTRQRYGRGKLDLLHGRLVRPA